MRRKFLMRGQQQGPRRPMGVAQRRTTPMASGGTSMPATCPCRESPTAGEAGCRRARCDCLRRSPSCRRFMPGLALSVTNEIEFPAMKRRSPRRPGRRLPPRAHSARAPQLQEVAYRLSSSTTKTRRVSEFAVVSRPRPWLFFAEKRAGDDKTWCAADFFALQVAWLPEGAADAKDMTSPSRSRARPFVERKRLEAAPTTSSVMPSVRNPPTSKMPRSLVRAGGLVLIVQPAGPAHHGVKMRSSSTSATRSSPCRPVADPAIRRVNSRRAFACAWSSIWLRELFSRLPDEPVQKYTAWKYS